MGTPICKPIYTEVDDINQVRRTFRQINSCLQDVEIEVGGSDAECFQVYDNKGLQIVDTTPASLRMNTVDINTNGSVFSWNKADDELTINKTGKFEFQFRVTVGEDSALTEVQCSAWLERDTGTGWAELPGTRCFVHTKQA